MPMLLVMGFGVQLRWHQDVLNQIVGKLEDNRFRFINISQIIPDIQVNHELYTLSPYDPHPNATAYHLIGKYLAETFNNSPCESQGRNNILE